LRLFKCFWARVRLHIASKSRSGHNRSMERSQIGVAWLAACFLWPAMALGEATPAQPSEPVIVVLGDSLTAGFGLAQDQSFPVQLEKALRAKGHDVTIVNAGVSGDTAANGLDRFDWAVTPETRAVIIELGGNDALQGIPPEATKKSLEEIIKRSEARGLPVLLAGMEAPRNLGKDYVEEFSAVYRDLAQRYNVVFYPFFLEGVVLDGGLMQGDGMHPNAKGVAKIVDGIMPKVEELVGKIEAK
jgi:acyl-CoA thioesterase I